MSQRFTSPQSLVSSLWPREGGPAAWKLFGAWVPYVLARRMRALIALRWVHFPAQGQATLIATLLSKQRRPSTPLVWMTVEASAGDGDAERVRVEEAVVTRLRELVPPELRAVVVTREPLGGARLLRRLEALGLDYVLQVAPDTLVHEEGGEARPARAWAAASPRPVRVRDVCLTAERVPVVALVRAPADAKGPPCHLATSLRTASAKTVVGILARLSDPRLEEVSPEELARLGLAPEEGPAPGQRDRLLFWGVLITELLTLLGSVGRALGLARRAAPGPEGRASRAAPRSLFQQGCILYQALPLMPGTQAHQLVAAFQQRVDGTPAFRELLDAL